VRDYDNWNPVLDRVRVYRTDYLVTARLGRGGRERLQVFDRTAGPEGDLRMLHVLSRSRHTEQQVKVLSRVARRNTAGPQILQYQVRDGKVFVVTTWLPGQDLASYLDDARAGRIPWPSAYLAFRMMRGFVHGLSRLHDRANVMHGDIKSANLIVAARGAELALIDYGSAWLEERTAGRDAGDGTTDGYAAPEVRAPGAVADWRSDQFSATVVLYELLTGALPYDGMGGMAGWTENRAQFVQVYVPPSGARREAGELPADAWRRIDELVARGLQWDAAARFATTGEWPEAFDAVNAVLQTPSKLGPWGRRFVRSLEWLLGRFRRKGGNFTC
jgi:serine/threonine protein kinase